MAVPNDETNVDERSSLLTRDNEQPPYSGQDSQEAPKPAEPVGSSCPRHDDAAKPTSLQHDRPSASSGSTTASTRAPRLTKIDTDMSWGVPAGLPIADPLNEELNVFRHALGINANAAPANKATDGGTLEQGRKQATGIYRQVLAEVRSKHAQYVAVSVLAYVCHLGQIITGALLTALGPSAGDHQRLITLLGAANTIIAGVLALLKGQGLPERLRKDEIEFRQLLDWIEETEALLAVGVMGRDRKEAGLLVEVAFKKYNAAKASEWNNTPDHYVRQVPERSSAAGRRDGDEGGHGPVNPTNAMVRLNLG